MNIIDLIARLTLDPSGFNKGVTDAQSKAQNFGASMSKMGGTLMKTGALVTAGITLPIIGIATAMVNSASDLNETVSKVGVVFGTQTEKILAFGETSAKALGMSKNEALAAAGTYGNLFRAMGMTEVTSADMSTSLVTLAGDLASFNNMDPTEVMDKLRAGLSGESEPLKSLGVNINDVIIKEKARELGLYSGSGALDASSKAQAVYALVLEQTSLAQGDFARTSEGLANSQRIMKAELADAAAKLGTQLLPIALKLVTTISNLVDKFSGMSPAGQKAVLVIGGIAAAIGPVITIIGTVMKVVGGLSTLLAGPAAAAIGAVLVPILPIIAIVAAVIAVVVLLYQAWKNNWFGIRDITAEVFSSIGTFFTNLWTTIVTWHMTAIAAIDNWVNGIVASVTNFITNVWTSITTGLANIWMTITTWFNNIIMSVATFFINLWTGFTTGLATIWMSVTTGLANIWTSITTWISGLITKFTTFVSQFIQVGKDLMSGFWNGITSWFTKIWDGIVEFVGKIVTKVKDALAGHSPSQVFFNIGASTMQGMSMGILANAGLVTDALAGISAKGLTGSIVGTLPTAATGRNQGAAMQAGSNKTTQITINNPVGESSEQSMKNSMQKLAYLGVM